MFSTNRLAAALIGWRPVAFLLTLLIAAGLLGTLLYQKNQALRGEIATAQAATKTAQDALKRERRANALREQRRAATARAEATATASLAAAVASHPQWADAPVPQEVQDALTR